MKWGTQATIYGVAETFHLGEKTKPESARDLTGEKTGVSRRASLSRQEISLAVGFMVLRSGNVR